VKYVAGLAVVLAAAAAYGNGRPPQTSAIYFKPGDMHSLYVRTTFGLFVTHDDGCTMSWVCETNMGIGGTDDPILAIGSDGTIFDGTHTHGIEISHDSGCSFVRNTSLPDSTWVDALDMGPTGEVWVATANGGAANDVFASTDNGATFTTRGLPSPTIFWKSVKIAPSNAQRVYVAGYQVAGTLPDGGQMQPTAHLEHTDNSGGAWIESPLGGVMQYGPMPTILVQAIDPTNADIAYISSLGAAAPSGDRLYRTTDAGQTLTEVLATTGTIANVVIKGQNVYVVTQVQSGQYLIGGPAYVSTDGGMSFNALTGSPELSCLSLRSDGVLYGCGANWDPDFMAVATSSDGMAWTKLWRFVQMYGPLDCPSGTMEHDVCNEQQWPGMLTQFAPTGPTCGSDSGQVFGENPVDVTPPPKKKTGCCDAGAGAPGSAALAGLVAIALRRRSRRR
jgi:hypothetical protein